jgi:hypothetical protein
MPRDPQRQVIVSSAALFFITTSGKAIRTSQPMVNRARFNRSPEMNFTAMLLLIISTFRPLNLLLLICAENSRRPDGQNQDQNDKSEYVFIIR